MIQANESIEPSRRAWLSVAAYAAMFVFGIVMALLGAVLPVLSEQLDFDLARAGNLFFTLNFAVMLSMLGIGPLMDRAGKRPVLMAGVFIVVVALLLIAGASSYSTLLIAVFLLGIGGAALNGASNMAITDLYTDPRLKSSAMNLLGVFFGIGASFLPLVIGSLLKSVGLTNILLVAVGLSVLPGILFLGVRFPAAGQAQGFRLAEAGQVIRNPLVLLFGFVLFFQSGSEFIISGYTSTFLRRDLGSSISSASCLLAVYWGCFVVGRIIASRLVLKVTSTTLVLASALGSALGAGLLAFSPTREVATLALAIIGLSFASIFPTTLSQAASTFHSYLGTVFGMLFAIALIGGMTMPWAVGQIADSHGLRYGLALVAGNFIMIFVLQLIILRRR